MAGGGWPEGDRGPLTSHFDLRAYADSFAGELSDLLNHTVTDGIRITAVTDRKARQARVGLGVSANDLGDFRMIPLAIRKAPKLYLGMLYKITPDSAGRYPMVHSSVMFLSPDDDTGGRVLLHYDYERDKKDGYPEAHLQICATSSAWEEAIARYGSRVRPLEKLHLPVGGRRFRPILEDLIEFLIIEKLAEHRSGWKDWVARGRDDFAERQLRAAVRRHPDVAISILREEGKI
jgi:hypothetical protein